MGGDGDCGYWFKKERDDDTLSLLSVEGGREGGVWRVDSVDVGVRKTE